MAMKVTMAKAMAMAIALTMLTLSMMTSLLKVTSVIIFYSAKKRSNNKRKRGGIFKILLARAGSNQSLEKIQHSALLLMANMQARHKRAVLPLKKPVVAKTVHIRQFFIN